MVAERLPRIELNSHHQFDVKPHEQNMRLDVFVTSHFPSYSRSFFQRLIEQNHIQLNGHTVVKQGVKLKVNDLVSIFFPAEERRVYNPDTQDLRVQVLFEHDHFLIINKPAGLNVHAPKSGYHQVSLVDWLLAHYETIASVGYDNRPGIVHRLDKDTSGIMIIARTSYAHAIFSEQFKKRAIKKIYHACVEGHPERDGSISLAIGRHPHQKIKMIVVDPKKIPIKHDFLDGYFYAPGIGRVRHAISDYKTIEYFKTSSLVEVLPVTGRTHQIRVHFAGIGHPLLGDGVYGDISSIIGRQALHAESIAFTFEGQHYLFSAPKPDDFINLIDILRN